MECYRSYSYLYTFLTYGNSKDIFPKHMHHEDVKNTLLKILEIEISEGVYAR